MNIFVGSLSFRLRDAELREVFEKYGEVSSAKVVIDKITGKSKGFGFVEMPDDNQAKTAISELNGRDMYGRPLVVNESQQREPRSQGSERPRFDNSRRSNDEPRRFNDDSRRSGGTEPRRFNNEEPAKRFNDDSRKLSIDDDEDGDDEPRKTASEPKRFNDESKRPGGRDHRSFGGHQDSQRGKGGLKGKPKNDYSRDKYRDGEAKRPKKGNSWEREDW